MCYFILASILISAALAQNGDDVSGSERSLHQEVINFHTPSGSHFQMGTPGQAVTGQYSYAGPDGQMVVVRYIADELGYRILDDNSADINTNHVDEHVMKKTVGDAVVVGANAVPETVNQNVLTQPLAVQLPIANPQNQYTNFMQVNPLSFRPGGARMFFYNPQYTPTAGTNNFLIPHQQTSNIPTNVRQFPQPILGYSSTGQQFVNFATPQTNAVVPQLTARPAIVSQAQVPRTTTPLKTIANHYPQQVLLQQPQQQLQYLRPQQGPFRLVQSPNGFSYSVLV